VVTRNQPIAEVETAKALVELPSPRAGRITALHAAEGETLAVGAPLIALETEAPGGADGEALRPAPVRTTPARKPTTRLRSPQDRVRRRRRRRPPTPPPPRRPLRGPSSPPRSASRCWSGTGRCCPAPGGPAVVRAPSRPSPTWAAVRRRPPAPTRRRSRGLAGPPAPSLLQDRPLRGPHRGAGRPPHTEGDAAGAPARP